MKINNKKRNIFAFIEGFLVSFFAMDSFNPEDRWGFRIIFLGIVIFLVIFLIYLFF